jgi:1-deoxy-D-xylulose-5-phosphate reductoisomerase
LAGTIRFDQIHSVNAHCLDRLQPEAGEAASVDGLLALDARTRTEARVAVKGCAA